MADQSGATIHHLPVGEPPARGVIPWLRFVWRRRLFHPRYWPFALRYLWVFKVRLRRVSTGGFVFLARGAEIECRRGLAHMELGRWIHLGRGTALRCHEGFMRVGDHTVFGAGVTVNGYLDVDIGAECLVADGTYVCDFDHRFDDPGAPIRKQGIVPAPVRIEDDCWIGTKVAVLRGVRIGAGSVIGAHAVVTADIPPGSVAAGIPARVVGRRGGAGHHAVAR